MRLDELERELRAERPKVDPDFARKLDDWAAAGFPRGGELGPRTAGRRWVGRRPRSREERYERSKRRWRIAGKLAPAGTALFLVAVIGIGIAQLPTSGDDDDGGTAEDGGAGVIRQSLPKQADDAAVPDSGGAEPATGGGTELRDSEGVLRSLNSQRGDRLAFGQGAEALDARDIGPAGRKQAQSVDLGLAAAPEDFRNTADGVLDVVDDHGGYVLQSNVSGGDPDVEGAKPGRANFDTRIPAGQLQAAIASFSDLGHVVSRTDGTVDITSRFTSAKRRIAAYTESRDRLLRQLEDADTETEQDAIRAQLRIVEAQLDAAQEDLGDAQQRVHLVPVSVTVTSDESVTGGDDGDWGLGDALDDAGKVLTVAGGVLVIGAAALLPIAILAFLAWLVADRARRRARERTLDA